VITLLPVAISSSPQFATPALHPNLWVVTGSQTVAPVEWSAPVTTIRLRTAHIANTPLIRGFSLFTKSIQQRATGLRVVIEADSPSPVAAGELVIRVELSDELAPESYTVT